jgi:hypothetical protein
MKIQEQLDLDVSRGLIKTIKEKKEILEHKNFIKLLIDSITFEHANLFIKNE